MNAYVPSPISISTPGCRELSGREAAEKHIELLTGSPDTEVDLRLIHDSKKPDHPATKLRGTIEELWPQIEAAQAQGYGVFIVVNDGGNTDAEIAQIRAVFVDADDVPLEGIEWHVTPDFIVQRDATHWHAYWRVCGVEVRQFTEIQKRLAGHYGTDPSVCNPSRVMRLAGTLHQKDKAQ